MNQGSVLLKEIQAEDFAVYEAILYLNAHQNCQEALNYYHEHRRNALALRKKYEEACGPLTMYGNEDNCHWLWNQAPWPWEKEAN